MGKKYLPLHEAAHRASVTERTFRSYIKAGAFREYRKGLLAPGAKRDTRPIYILAADLTEERIYQAQERTFGAVAA